MSRSVYKRLKPSPISLQEKAAKTYMHTSGYIDHAEKIITFIALSLIVLYYPFKIRHRIIRVIITHAKNTTASISFSTLTSIEYVELLKIHG